MKPVAGTWRAVIVDDEPPARQTLRMLLAREKDFTVAAECGHGRGAIEAVAATRPDVLFLDVRMPGLDGFAVLREIGADAVPAIVFVTAYDRYAPQAFEQHAVEYLLKPFTDERFAGVVDHVRRRLRERTLASLGERLPDLLVETAARADRRQIVVKDGSRTHVIPEAEIVWVEAEDYYVAIHANGRRVLAAAAEDDRGAARSGYLRACTVGDREHPLHQRDRAGGLRRSELVLSDGTVLRVAMPHRAALMRRL